MPYEQTKRSPRDIQLDNYTFQCWLRTDESDHDHNFALQNLRIAIREELTDKQRSYMTMYFVDGLTMCEIAKQHGVTLSTVSRTISRGEKRIAHVVKYSSPALLSSYINKIER